jgi:single-stranded DNA-specific DHH superfamily exonuclease
MRNMLNELTGKGILIHHWDTDGICSARLILKHLADKDIDNKTPNLGNYFLTEEELESYSKYDFVIIADMNLPEDNILRLAKNAKVMIFDHHLGKVITQVFHHNPVIKGENPNDYPSASWIINDYLGNKVNLFALLGIVGDHEQKIKNNNKFYTIINNYCNENNLTFEDLHHMVYLLDSNYKKGDKTAIEKAPHILLKTENPNDILDNIEWNKNYELLEQEIKKQINEPSEVFNETILKKMNTSFNIISTVTRKLAWEKQKNTIVVNTGFFKDLDQLYVRTINKNMEPMIKRGKDLGFKCGGKKEVLGALIPKDQTNGFIEEVKQFFKED